MANEDYYMYVIRSKSNFAILKLYMDDILLAANGKKFVITIKYWLSLNFEMKDIGEVAYILGVNIYRDCSNKVLALLQESYIRKIIE